MTMRPRTHSSSQSFSSTSRRASTASEYSGWRDSNGQEQKSSTRTEPKQPHSPENLIPNHGRQSSIPHDAPPLVLPQYDQTSSCKACIGVNIIHTCTLTPKLKGPVVLGPSITVDNWVPQRPPKNPA
ncbi:uncharacterized protein LOC113363982 [Ctenocephalides felis]|uniref:uncharacterized protein LOC113363982 n=1 Tax=Ctenocephalides felis TaxID=7515 RepID=UPI000E6E3571|nr:uncharacterized protein LOC113363982 [Ctenocephalides felis]